jgi:hypothetical protein
LVSVLLAHGRLKHTLIEESFVLEVGSVRRPSGAAKYAVNSSRRRWWWPRNARTPASNTLVSKERATAKRQKNTKDCVRFAPSRATPKKSLNFI